MFCPTCGAQIPDDSVFCRSCGAPIPGAAPAYAPAPEPAYEQPKEMPPIITNLLNSLKAFFTPKPDEGIALAGSSNTYEGAILLGANLIIFALSFAVNMRQIVGSVFNMFGSLGGYGSMIGSSGTSMLVNFGLFLLFGFLISLVANIIVFGAYFLLEKVVHHGEQNIFNVLNTVGYSTIPFTLICLLNMLLGLIWGVLVVPFMMIAGLAQVLLLYVALQKNAEDGRVNYLAFIGVSLVALFLTLLFGYLFTKAGFTSSINAAMSSYGIGW